MGTKFVFVTGGVVSGLGKGITAASLGRLLKARGLKVAIQKMDPYLNVDPGKMSPYQHGEVFVTEDGAETDLDIGHYERFTDESMNRDSNCTAGRIYYSVLNQEREGQYGGKTVQFIPHITDEIKRRILAITSMKPDVIITEIGGTVGDMESLSFLEAIRQMRFEREQNSCVFIHVTLVPYLESVGEIKTKPTQHSVKELRSLGIQPDIIVCRSEVPLGEEVKEKIGLYCSVDRNSVIENLDLESLYEVPLHMQEQGLDEIVIEKLKLSIPHEPDMTAWKKMVEAHKNPTSKVKIALVGSYVELHDAYISAVEALAHAGIHYRTEIDLQWVQAKDLKDYPTCQKLLQGTCGVIVPGAEEALLPGHIYAARYAREQHIPYLGVSTGMQAAVLDIATQGLEDNTLKEECLDHLASPYFIGGKTYETNFFNGTTNLRTGAWDCVLEKDSVIEKAYGTTNISERHRHGSELNKEYIDTLLTKGLKVQGTNPDTGYCEVVELEHHPFYMGVIFNPEFKSRPDRPHPLYRTFIEHAKGK